MKTAHSFENKLRSPNELAVALVSFLMGSYCVAYPAGVALTHATAIGVSVFFFGFGLWRACQGYAILRYRKRLLTLRYFAMATTDVPLSKDNFFIGRGFQWLPIHRQRLHLLSQVHHQFFMQPHALYRFVQRQADTNPNGFFDRVRRCTFLPFQPLPDVGGKPWLHGVGCEEEQAIFVKQANRNSHTIVFGQSRVGKTRLLSLLVNQDIRNGEAVLVIDPKGDLDVLQDMLEACRVSGRLADFKICHAGFPALSAKYNPLAHYSNLSEIATRVTSAIQAEGEGKQFQDFAWKFLNVVVTCLAEMHETISYQSLAFFVTRPKQLLLAYCDKILPDKDPAYLNGIKKIIEESSEKRNKQGKPLEPLSRADAVRKYIGQRIESLIQEGNYQALSHSMMADLHHAAELGEEYYSKITASLGPVFDKINKTAAGDIFSWEQDTPIRQPIIHLEEVIKQQQVVYIGLDAMSNKAMSDAVGQAVIADLISLCGRLYKETPDKNRILNLYADEFSEIVRDEFVTLLNKAGGSGVRVTAFAQTVNDLGVAFAGNFNKPQMLLGNFGTRVMLRVSNLDTARVFTECLEKIRSRSTTPSSITHDKPDGNNGGLFTTTNSDGLSEENTEIINENDVFSLPKGQAFVLTNGGTLYKIRIPLPKRTSDCPATFEAVLAVVNQVSSTLIQPEKHTEVAEKANVLQEHTAISEEKEQKKEEEKGKENTPSVKEFMTWIIAGIERSHAAYPLGSVRWAFIDKAQYGETIMFVSSLSLEKYAAEKSLSLEALRAYLVEQYHPKGTHYYCFNTKKERLDLIRLNDMPCPSYQLTQATIQEVTDGNHEKNSD